MLLTQPAEHIKMRNSLPKRKKILFISTYPPVECGIATYTKDLINAIEKQFNTEIECVVCNLCKPTDIRVESGLKLNPNHPIGFLALAQKVNQDKSINLVHIQHEFGLFGGEYGNYLMYFMRAINKPVILTFHSVLPNPNDKLKSFVIELVSYAQKITVMTSQSQVILTQEYGVNNDLIEVIPHGTHLVKLKQKKALRSLYQFENSFILSTFGLMGPGKSIETAIKALPKIIKQIPNAKYLVLGKTHPNHTRDSHDVYRDQLESLVQELNLQNHVVFINEYLHLDELLDLLQATDIYLFTSKDPNQAVSGTFAYAMSCGCPIVATTNTHTKEILTSDLGVLIDIDNHKQLADSVIKLHSNKALMKELATNAFQTSIQSSWENVAIKHVKTYLLVFGELPEITFNQPGMKLDHLKNLTTETGIIQFSNIGIPDIESGYTLDDNSRALIVMCYHFQMYKKRGDLNYINIYLSFLEKCQKLNGGFINYLDKEQKIHIKNNQVNLEDSNARAIWALGTVISMHKDLPVNTVLRARKMMLAGFDRLHDFLSPRSIGFIIKGLYLYNQVEKNDRQSIEIFTKLSNRLISHYHHNATTSWPWFENYLTYANSILPESMLYAYLTTSSEAYKKVALESFDFLMSNQFDNKHFKTISNDGWYHKDQDNSNYGEQPIDVSYSINTLELFYKTFDLPVYKEMMQGAFSWFLGNNHLNQVMYNSATGGGFDGLEKSNVNINQGAESTLCFLMAQLTMERNKDVIFDQQFMIDNQKLWIKL